MLCVFLSVLCCFFFFKQKTAYELRISDCSSDVCASDLVVRKQGGLVFADCSQSAGKLPLPQADMIAISAHKFGGPSGVGALLIRDLTLIHPSGGQEQGYRAGTENVPAVMSMAVALEARLDW